jgi:NAD(P)H-hydrate epimerase
MKIITTSQMRELDRLAISAGTAGETLMETAGEAVADAACQLARRFRGNSILVFAGKGNNGGDAFVAARRLRAHGFSVTLALCCRPSEIKGDALKHFQRLNEPLPDEWAEEYECNIETVEIHNAKDALAAFDKAEPIVVVDGLLGTGLEGAPRSPIAEIIDAINFREIPVVAIDVPSGLNSDTGESAGAVIHATVTVTMGLPKIGLVRPCALDIVGRLEIADLGIPRSLLSLMDTDVHLITADDVRRLLPARKRTAHKGAFGHVLVLAGCEGLTGAAVLCAEAVARSGAGLVTLAVPQKIYSIIAAQCREVMPRPLADTDAGSFSLKALDGIDDLIARCNVVALGPGIGQHPETREFVHRFIARCLRPMVLDADALNAIAHKPSVLKQAKAAIVVTPHPGEMARLTDSTTERVQSRRWETAREIAAAHGVVTVLKGAGTVIARPDSQEIWLNMTGNPGMAKGGMGDVLTGLIAGFIAQGISPFDAARVAVHLHGLAADAVATKTCEQTMRATDVLENLSTAIQQTKDIHPSWQ